MAAGQVTLDIGRYNPVTQLLDENHALISADGISLGAISLRLANLRLANPPEFDLMAGIAGLRLRHRTAGRHGEPFTASSWRHVSLYEPVNRGGVN